MRMRRSPQCAKYVQVGVVHSERCQRFGGPLFNYPAGKDQSAYRLDRQAVQVRALAPEPFNHLIDQVRFWGALVHDRLEYQIRNEIQYNLYIKANLINNL